MKKSYALRIYILILFLIPLVTARFECLWAVFLFCVMSLPVHSVILGVIAGRNIEKRRFFPLIPLLLLLAFYLFSFTHNLDPSREGGNNNLFVYIIHRIMEAYTIMGFSDNVAVNDWNGTVQPVYDGYGTFGGYDLPIPLIILFASPLFCWISMRITAAIHKYRMKKKHNDA